MNDDVNRRYHSNIKQEKIRKETFSQSAYAFSAIILRVTQQDGIGLKIPSNEADMRSNDVELEYPKSCKSRKGSDGIS